MEAPNFATNDRFVQVSRPVQHGGIVVETQIQNFASIYNVQRVRMQRSVL